MAKNARSERKQISDQLRNIRRRFERAAAREERAAAKEKDGYKKNALLNQAEYYRRQAESYKASNLTKGLKKNSAAYAEALKAAVPTGQRESGRTLSSKQDRNKLARAILQGNKASTFFAMTKELWLIPGEDGSGLNYYTRMERVIEGLGVSDALEAIETIEQGLGYSFQEPLDEIGGPSDKYDRATVREGMFFVANILNQRH